MPVCGACKKMSTIISVWKHFCNFSNVLLMSLWRGSKSWDDSRCPFSLEYSNQVALRTGKNASRWHRCLTFKNRGKIIPEGVGHLFPIRTQFRDNFRYFLRRRRGKNFAEYLNVSAMTSASQDEGIYIWPPFWISYRLPSNQCQTTIPHFFCCAVLWRSIVSSSRNIASPVLEQWPIDGHKKFLGRYF